jgi:hypothetical protein
MTEPDRAAHLPPKRPRLSKRVLRAWAWIAGGVALFAPLGALAAQPKIALRAAAPTRPVVIRKVLRRIIVVSPKTNPAPQRIVYVGGGSGGGGSAPAPVTTTGGSAPPP